MNNSVLAKDCRFARLVQIMEVCSRQNTCANCDIREGCEKAFNALCEKTKDGEVTYHELLRYGFCLWAMLLKKDGYKGVLLTRDGTPTARLLRKVPENGISIRQASRKYNLPFTTLQRWVNKGYISIIKTTRNWIYINECDLQIYLEKQGRSGSLCVVDDPQQKELV